MPSGALGEWTANGGHVPKWVLLVVIVLVGLYVIANPSHSAAMASSTWHWAHHAGQKLSSFVNDL